MNDLSILNKIRLLNCPANGYIFTEIDGLYWGIDKDGFCTYGMLSNEKAEQFIQSTKYLRLQLNVLCEVNVKDNISEKKLSILTIKSNEESKVLMFIRIIKSFPLDNKDSNLLKYFLYLKELFSNEYKMSDIELQGLYGELYSILYFYDKFGFNLSNYYQKVDKMKFDFSLDDVRKIDSKTTIKSDRTHHFLQEQLNILRYDIKIISIMLEKDDCGLSLFDLVNLCKEKFSNNFSLIFHIELSLKNIPEEKIKSIKFNQKYTNDNIKVFDAKDIPRVTEKNKDGVFNVEFDSNLSNITELSDNDIVNWLN